MRILGVVTLVSPLGEYGGPLRVAVNQLRELASRGHEVLLVGSHRGYDGAPPTEIEGVPARLYPARTVLPGAGFAGLTSPGLLSALRRNVASFDVVHVHAARDLVTLPAARIAQRAGVRTILQTHGMIDESDNPLAIPVDAALTRPALRDAAAVTYLTPEEQRSVETVARGVVKLVHLTNGVPTAPEEADAAADADQRPTDADQRPTDAAQHHTDEVLYLARLAPRKNAVLFAEVATDLAIDFPQTRFSLVGPDEGSGPEVRRIIEESHLGDRLQWEGALAPEKTLQRMRQASVYVLPSVNEPYPMSVLEAMSIGLPVILTKSCGLAGFVSENDAGLVVEPTREAVRTAIAALLADPAESRAKGERGRDAVRRSKSMSAVADELLRLYSA